MANSHPDSAAAVAWIQAQNPDWTKNNAELVAWLNGLTIANPLSATQIPQPIVAADLWAKFSVDSLKAVRSEPGFDILAQAVTSGNRAVIIGAIEFAAAVGDVQPSEATAALSYLNEMVADPAWPTTIPAAENELGRGVDGEDVQKARPV